MKSENKKNTKHGLGQGLANLIPVGLSSDLLLSATEKIHNLDVKKIDANKSQPRSQFIKKELQELADSIKEHGILQPLIVSPLENGRYMIVAGERRYRAALINGLKTVPAVIRTTKDIENTLLALVENVQRVDLEPLEEAKSFLKLHEQFNLSYDKIAQYVGKSLSAVSNTARLLNLPKYAQDALDQKKISGGHARAILALKDYPDHQSRLLKHCVNGWSVRQAERYAVSVKSGIVDVKQAKQRVSLTTADTNLLTKKFKTPVQIRRLAKGGRLEIVFKDDQDLKRIFKVLGLKNN